ncbi:unnamed protein product [Bursaphelenchus okinawaensis]|uniref:Matrix-remodeling-associated protein 7 helical domain-containing protein n=1 Tax=Bursaphelenchus okinawaensis TaxID=465554 RepID=A0A811KFB4_9BILA|nr:unnamed protein product [Bursaphelenchus okinawaensis]CAG9102263.1 unnamed protein product [Bursaphelenchus okinawaensis]
MAFDELLEEMGGAETAAGQTAEAEEEVVTEPWWLIARRFGLNTYHPSVADLFNDPTVRTALAICILSAIAAPLFTMFAYRFWRKKQNEKAGYASVDSSQPGHFNADLLASITEPKQPKVVGPKKNKKRTKRTGHQQIPSDEAECSDDSSAPSSCISSPEVQRQPKLTKKEEKYAVDEFTDFTTGKSTKIRFADENEQNSKSTGKKSTEKREELLDQDGKEEDVKKLVDMQWHGKLATAKLRAKANKLQESMTEQEKKEEQRLKNEQLEKIFALMQQEQDKFGVADKSDLMEQMKMYSI